MGAEQKLRNYLIENGAKEMLVNNETVYEHKGKFYILSTGNTHFILESAMSIDDVAENNTDDIGMYARRNGDDSLVSEIKSDMDKFIFNA